MYIYFFRGGEYVLWGGGEAGKGFKFNFFDWG